MAKTDETIRLEKMIYTATKKMGVFSCFEVTIGFHGKERVDYMTYDTKGIFRCYEIKVSLSDFKSKSKNTFCGHYNYYVLTKDLYDRVIKDIPSHVGVFVEGSCVKKPKKQDPKIPLNMLKDSMIRSLCRESDKLFKMSSGISITSLKKRVQIAEKDAAILKKENRSLKRELQEAKNEKRKNNSNRL